MKLKFVTLTGADSKTDATEMAKLSKKYNFAEWAILFNQSKVGPRYPSYDWVESAIEKISETWIGTNLAAHLCGKWVDDANRGRITFLNADISDSFGRIQLNMAGTRLQDLLLDKTSFWKCGLDRPIILGGPYQKYKTPIPVDRFMNQPYGIFPLFDCSGGRGILAEEWPAPVMTEYGEPLLCGYAGGLGPDNIVEELTKIESVVGDAEIWIDMESKLRNSKDEFDLEKCEQVLSAAQRWA